MRQPGQSRHIVDSAERVGGRAESEQTHSGRELAGEVFLIEPTVLASHPDGAYLDSALLRERPPGVGVRMVVELGDDYDVPLPPFAPERTAEVDGERGHVGAEHDLFGRAPDPVGERATRLEEGMEIGRASCRERGSKWGVTGAEKETGDKR